MWPLILACVLAAGQTASPSAEEFRRAAAEAQARHPSLEANAAAKKLEELAAALGADLAPPLPDRAHPTLSDGDQLKKIGLASYLLRHAESSDDVVSAPPAAISFFLSEHTEQVDRLVNALTTGEPPIWDFAVPHRENSPEPNHEGHLNVQRILLCRALAEIQQGRHANAAQYLEASWRLKEATAARPSIVWQLLAIAAARWEAGVLRKLPTPDPGWAGRLSFEPQRKRTLDVIADELLLSERADRYTEADFAESVAYLNGVRRATETLGTMDPCSLTTSAGESVWRRAFEGQQTSLTEITVPNLLNMIRRAYRLQLEGELTAKVLQARAGGGAFEPESKVCPGARWSANTTRDGATNVRFAGRYEEFEAGLRPPLEFTIRPAPGPMPTPVHP